MTHAAPRLVLPLLLKAQKFANMPGYYLHNGRWKAVAKHGPAPKGAPVAHDHAAHAAAPAKHLSDAEWSQLKLPAENQNSGHFNAQLDKLKEWSEGGHGAAILGHSYGTNTYGKKLATIANHLLGKMGSAHKVAPGQKAGEHAAVQAPAEAKAPAPAPAPVEPPAPPAPAPAPAPTEGISVAEKEQIDKMAADEDWSLLDEAIQDMSPEAKAYGQKLIDQAWDDGEKQTAAPAADPGPKDGDTKEGADGTLVFKDGRWHKQAEPAAAAEPAAQPDAAPAALAMPAFQEGKTGGPGVVEWYTKVAEQIFDLASKGDHAGLLMMKTKGLTPNSKGKISNTWAGKTPNSKLLLKLHADALAHAKGDQTPVKNETPSAATDSGVAPAAEAEPIKKEREPASEPAPTPDGELSADSKKMIDGLVADGKVATLEMYAAGGKAAVKNYAQQKLAEMKTAAKPPAEPVAPAPDIGAGVTAEQLQQLQSIPWHKLKLPDSNSNAASVNKKLQALQDAAFAGDVAAIEAMTWGKNTYNKKLELAAQTALAALKQTSHSAATQAPSVTSEAAAFAGASMPTPPVVGMEYQKQTEKIESAIKEGKSSWLITMSDWANGNDPDVKAVGEYAKAGLAYLEQKAKETAAPASEPTPVASAGQAAVTPADHLAGQFLQDKAINPEAVEIFKVASEGQEGSPAQLGAAIKAVSESGFQSSAAAMLKIVAKQYAGGPVEGDTKVENGKTYKLINGKWHLVGEPEAAAPEPAQHWVDSVPVPPAIKQAINPNWTSSVMKSIAKLQAALKAGDTSVLKGATKHITSTGNHIVKLPHYKDQWDGTGQTATFSGKTLPMKALYDYVEALKSASGKPAKKSSKPKAAAAAPSPSFTGAPEPMDSWTQTGGQGGSNPGGKFKDQNGVEWYCKFPGDDDTAKSEVLAAKLYSLAGLAAQDAKLITKDGKLGIASKWVDVKKASPADLSKVPDAQAGFAVDAWLANWDAVGLAFDNLQVGPDGKAMRVDAGGSLEYRAQGAKKPFGTAVTEMDTLRDQKIAPQAAKVFGGMTEADITASVAKVLKISDVAIRAMVNQFGPGDAAAKQKLADTLIARKQWLAEKYPQAAKQKKAIVFKPEEISAPPSFTNWGGTGKSGPSSKEFVNLANEEAVQAIYAAAKTGSMEAVQKLKAKTYDKDTGAVTGETLVVQHPSQHVKGYAQQAINEINYQLNPPKKFRFEGGHPLAALNSAYPAHPGAAVSPAIQKLAKYVVLGEPGTIKVEDLHLPEPIKHSSAGGTLTTSTYSKAAQQAVAQMPKTQQQAIQSYTGAGYHQMNGSLWSGNPSGAAKAAGEALKTLGHDIAPGTLLSRKISLNGADLDALLKSQGKVLQEPAIMSTSIRPSSWSGNVQLKLRVGPGVKGLWVGPGSMPGGGAMSKHAGEDELILPPNTRMLVVKVSKGKDSDGFGDNGMHVVECVILPT